MLKLSHKKAFTVEGFFKTLEGGLMMFLTVSNRQDRSDGQHQHNKAQ